MVRQAKAVDVITLPDKPEVFLSGRNSFDKPGIIKLRALAFVNQWGFIFAGAGLKNISTAAAAENAPIGRCHSRDCIIISHGQGDICGAAFLSSQEKDPFILAGHPHIAFPGLKYAVELYGRGEVREKDIFNFRDITQYKQAQAGLYLNLLPLKVEADNVRDTLEIVHEVDVLSGLPAYIQIMDEAVPVGVDVNPVLIGLVGIE